FMTMDLCETSNVEWNDPDNTYDCLDSNFSLATDSVSEISSVLNDNNSHKFFFNYKALQKTHESIYNIDDDVTMNNIKDDSSFISSERNSTDFNALEEDYEIDDIPCENLVLCVVLDIYDGEIRHCPNYEKSRYRLRSLRQLIGTWEIDKSVVDKNNPKSMVHTLGVCSSHFSFDQNRLYSAAAKQEQPIENSGHLFKRKRTGVKSYTCHDQHVDDSKNALILLGRWLTVIAESNDKKLKQDTLNKMTDNHQLEKLLMSENQSNKLAKASLKDHLFEIGPSTFTNQMFLKFENIFYNLSACNEKEVDIDKVYEELVKLIEPGCQVPVPNIVILEPGDNPCSDEAVHKACKMFFDNIGKKTNRHGKID
ncbi:43414_t:CDS:2, partial [Gigaspora margarita]